MTIFLPLEGSSPFPHNPSFLVPSLEPASHVQKVVKAIMKARRIAVVCGAGISVQAGIPDFRSSDGLFQNLKKDNPSLSSGKDLFDASVFNSESTTSLFCQMIAQLSELSQAAHPTAFHELLRALDNRGKLLRVYTQNIDALEHKSGLTFGIPELEGKRYKPRSKCKPESSDDASFAASSDHPASRLSLPPVETPRCIPLHGTLQSMHCQTCTHSFPLQDYLPTLSEGRPPCCPECAAMETTRQLVGKRSRGVGKLRPSVVLYNEVHKDGEGVGEVVRRDLVGSSKGKGRAGADLLLVVGTSLRVPGTKRIVREFSKAVRSRITPSLSSQPEASTSSIGLATPTPSPRRSPTDDDELPVKTVYLNLDFPVPTREWEGVFDVWIRGDAQDFARLVHAEMEREERAKEAASERKRRREEAARLEEVRLENPDIPVKTNKKRKLDDAGSLYTPSASAKRKKGMLLTPISPLEGRPDKRRKPASDVLPSWSNGKGKGKDTGKARLTIKIPPRALVPPITPPPSKRGRVVPEVVIRMPCTKTKFSARSTTIKVPAVPSALTPPDSPLTPVPSPQSRHRKIIISQSRERSPSSCRRPIASGSTIPYHRFATHDDDIGWEDEELSDLTEDDISDTELVLPDAMSSSIYNNRVRPRR